MNMGMWQQGMISPERVYFTKQIMNDLQMYYIVIALYDCISASPALSGSALKYKTLLQRISTSPRFPVH